MDSATSSSRKRYRNVKTIEKDIAQRRSELNTLLQELDNHPTLVKKRKVQVNRSKQVYKSRLVSWIENLFDQIPDQKDNAFKSALFKQVVDHIESIDSYPGEIDFHCGTLGASVWFIKWKPETVDGVKQKADHDVLKKESLTDNWHINGELTFVEDEFTRRMHNGQLNSSKQDEQSWKQTFCYIVLSLADLDAPELPTI